MLGKLWMQYTTSKKCESCHIWMKILKISSQVESRHI